MTPTASWSEIPVLPPALTDPFTRIEQEPYQAVDGWGLRPIFGLLQRRIEDGAEGEGGLCGAISDFSNSNSPDRDRETRADLISVKSLSSIKWKLVSTTLR